MKRPGITFSRADWTTLGFYRVASVCPELHLGDPVKNAEVISKILEELSNHQVQLAVFPELCLTGYTVEDLHLRQELLEKTQEGLRLLLHRSKSLDLTFIVGGPYGTFDGRVFNTAFVLHRGQLLGAVPKTFLPNYGEFYEKRWFKSGEGTHLEITDKALGKFWLTSEQLFTIGEMVLGVEICEDLWAPNPVSTGLALRGANVIANLSASNDLVGKAQYRRDLVKNQSARLNAAYIYSSAGPGESTKDVVFGGQLLIAENGVMLSERQEYSFHSNYIQSDIDVQKLMFDRRRNGTFTDSVAKEETRVVSVPLTVKASTLQRSFSKTPFVPDAPSELNARAEEILKIQATGLARRLRATKSENMVLGVSGGVDSTLALLVAVEATKILKKKTQSVIGVGMPGFGTTDRTKSQAEELAKALGVTWLEIPIVKATEQHLKDIGHDTKQEDVVFENAQARERTQILFDLANQRKAIVVGTGDLSEQWLGWATYNGDHMANYNVNASIPKTLVKHLVKYYAENRGSETVRTILEKILDTPISPELKRPGKKGEIVQETESILGPYMVHDFFLYHHLRNGFGEKKLLSLALHVFSDQFNEKDLQKWLTTFLTRGYKSQFKRTTTPPGPKVGSVSLSPRGDLRLPDELE